MRLSRYNFIQETSYLRKEFTRKMFYQIKDLLETILLDKSYIV